LVFLNRESSGNLTTTQLILFIVYLRSFLYLHKETNQRKCSLSLVPLDAGCPVLLKITGRCETREVYAL